MAKYLVKSPLKYKGKRREIGNIVDITEDDIAEELVQNGTIEAKGEGEPKAKAKGDK